MLQTNYGYRFAALDFLYIFQPPFLMQTEKLYLFVSKPILKQPICSNSSIHTGGNPVTKPKWGITTVMTVFSVVLIILHLIGYSPMLNRDITTSQRLRWIFLLSMC